MDQERYPVQRPDAPVIESPSGTTDPDNSNSGVAAYVIFAILIALLALMYLGVSSCVSTIGSIVAAHPDDFDSPSPTELTRDWELLEDDSFEGEDLFGGLDGEPLSRT